MKLRIEQDCDALNPRTEFDQLGKIVHWHRRYDLGERISGVWQAPAGSVVLPLALLDHSGLHLWVGDSAHDCDPGGWDSGPVGFIYMDAETIRKEFGAKARLPETKERIREILRAEVEEFDQYLQGDVWYYTIQDDAGNIVDSCGGLFGRDYAEQQARESLANCEAAAQVVKSETLIAQVWP